jgi:Holliday junction resolvase RusA-like endonuclease
MTPIEFFVPGKPQTAGSKQAFIRSGRAIVTDANKKTKPWQAQVAMFASQAYQGPLLDFPLMVSMVFFRLRPKGHFGTGKNEGVLKKNAPIAPAVMPDLLKWTRAVEDALTKVVWTDDARIVVEPLQKVYATVEGVAVQIREADRIDVAWPRWACELIARDESW